MNTSEKILETFFKESSHIINLPSVDEAKLQYNRGEPYPHLVIENFFTESVANEIAHCLVHDADFQTVYTDDFQRGKSTSTGEKIPRMLQAVASRITEPYMLKYLEQVTGEKCLIANPYYNTNYGYYHIVNSGGVLGSHVDHSHHDKLGIPHVLNIVVYLTPDWDEKDGGAFCLYGSDGKRIEKKIACKFNTAVVFAYNPIAYHGVEPIKIESDKKRHSIYLAFYSTDPETNLKSLYPKMLEGDKDRNIIHGTYFVVPFWQLLKRSN